MRSAAKCHLPNRIRGLRKGWAAWIGNKTKTNKKEINGSKTKQMVGWPEKRPLIWQLNSPINKDGLCCEINHATKCRWAFRCYLEPPFNNFRGRAQLRSFIFRIWPRILLFRNSQVEEVSSAEDRKRICLCLRAVMLTPIPMIPCPPLRQTPALSPVSSISKIYPIFEAVSAHATICRFDRIWDDSEKKISNYT